jgi:hypothetical protein
MSTGSEPRVIVDSGIGTPVAISATEAAGANTPCVAALAAQAAHTNYLTGIILTGGIAGTVLNLLCTVAGLIGGTWDLVMGLSTTVDSIIQMSFVQPVPASGVNTAITATIPATGASGPVVAAVLTGYYI